MDSITDEEFYGSTSFTTKGRRTKRRRIVTTSTHGVENCLGNISYGSSSNSATPSTVDDHEIMSEVTTEEEDLANCLILLAQGLQNRPSNLNITNNIKIGSSGNYKRPSLRKLIVIDNNDVYECKTCNKTFSSFQALGGHRTSHKKIVKPPPPPTPPPKPDDGQQNEGATNKSRSLRHIDTAKMHECSICGSEFPSGQALGGHMRRHRSLTVAPTAVASSSTAEIGSGGTTNILSLDLNLPAPHDHDDHEDDHMVDTMFHVILPTPALVDCHY